MKSGAGTAASSRRRVRPVHPRMPLESITTMEPNAASTAFYWPIYTYALDVGQMVQTLADVERSVKRHTGIDPPRDIPGYLNERADRRLELVSMLVANAPRLTLPKPITDAQTLLSKIFSDIDIEYKTARQSERRGRQRPVEEYEDRMEEAAVLRAMRLIGPEQQEGAGVGFSRRRKRVANLTNVVLPDVVGPGPSTDPDASITSQINAKYAGDLARIRNVSGLSQSKFNSVAFTVINRNINTNMLKTQFNAMRVAEQHMFLLQVLSNAASLGGDPEHIIFEIQQEAMGMNGGGVRQSRPASAPAPAPAPRAPPRGRAAYLAQQLPAASTAPASPAPVPAAIAAPPPRMQSRRAAILMRQRAATAPAPSAPLPPQAGQPALASAINLRDLNARTVNAHIDYALRAFYNYGLQLGLSPEQILQTMSNDIKTYSGRDYYAELSALGLSSTDIFRYLSLIISDADDFTRTNPAAIVNAIRETLGIPRNFV